MTLGEVAEDLIERGLTVEMGPMSPGYDGPEKWWALVYLHTPPGELCDDCGEISQAFGEAGHGMTAIDALLAARAMWASVGDEDDADE